MPYVSVYISEDEILDDVSDEALLAELRRRNLGECISRKDAQWSIDQASQTLRKMERYDLAYRLDEIRHDYFQ